MEDSEKARIEELAPQIFQDDNMLRALIYLEVLSRSRKDLKILIKNIFDTTWEFKILSVFLQGPSYKTQICEKLFPNAKDCHHKLSRPSPIFYAFEHLLGKKIIVEKSKEGKMTLYELSSTYKPIIHSLINVTNTHD